MITRITNVLGILCILAAFVLALESAFFVVASGKTTATVEQLDSMSSFCRTGSRYNRKTVPAVSYRAVMSYTAADGKNYFLILPAGKTCGGYGNPSYAQGDPVTVRYLRMDPAISRLDSFRYFWGISCILLLSGIFIVAVAPYFETLWSRWAERLLAVAGLLFFLVLASMLPDSLPRISGTLLLYELLFVTGALAVSALLVTLLSGKSAGSIHSSFPPLALILNTENSFIFFLASISAKLAKADGHVSEDEISAIERFLRDRLATTESQTRYFMEIFRRSLRSLWSFGALRALFYFRYKKAPEALSLLIDALILTGKADRKVTAEEKHHILQTAELFGMHEKTFSAFYGYAGGWDNAGEKQEEKRDSFSGGGSPLAEAYYILGCSPSDNFEKIRAAYRRLCKIHHPDRAIGKGFPPNIVKAADDRFKKINEAYERISISLGKE